MLQKSIKMLKPIPNPTVQIPQWIPFDPQSPSDSDDPELADPATDLVSSDEFRIYDFKVRRCPRARAHDWTDCPFAHPGEKARRRDPRKFHYSGVPCPDFKKGACDRGDSCEFAHGVFECWLHPSRYRTQPCKDGTACRRRVCFFAHTPEQLRVTSPKASRFVPDGYDGSPIRRMKSAMGSSPTSVMSPPISPDGLVVMMGKMRWCGSSPSAPRAKRAVGFEVEDDNSESFDGIDVGWVSELVK